MSIILMKTLLIKYKKALKDHPTHTTFLGLNYSIHHCEKMILLKFVCDYTFAIVMRLRVQCALTALRVTSRPSRIRSPRRRPYIIPLIIKYSMLIAYGYEFISNFVIVIIIKILITLIR